MGDQLVLRINVKGRPATLRDGDRGSLGAAVRVAVAASGCQPIRDARFGVRLDFRLAEARTAAEVWDLDNLIKPTLDAMEGVFGLRPWKGLPQPADDRVDRIDAARWRPSGAEASGATIEASVLALSDP